MTQQVSCKRKVKNPGEYKPASGCKGPKPAPSSKSCYTKPCPAEWVPSAWGKVNTNQSIKLLIIPFAR